MLRQFLRTKEHKPYGLLISYKDSDDKVRFGFSKYNEKLEVVPFTKKEALRIALDNSKKNILFIRNKRIERIISRQQNKKEFDPIFIYSNIQPEAIKFIERSTKYFKQCPVNVRVLNIFNFMEKNNG